MKVTMDIELFVNDHPCQVLPSPIHNNPFKRPVRIQLQTLRTSEYLELVWFILFTPSRIIMDKLKS